MTAFLAALLASGPVHAAREPVVELGDGDCNGDVEVQAGTSNRYDCDSCHGSVVVQVGLDNRVDCGGDSCLGNLVVQAGLRNSVDCAAGLLPGLSATAAVASAPPCPWPLPPENFYCHAAARILPDEVCLTLDFCLW